ncbi:lipopolysaccharide biosynthesis protein [Paenibacillus sp. strain BS8-2]
MNGIAKKSVIYFLGTVSSKAVFAILIPVYAYYVTADDLGYFDYSQTLVNILMPVLYIAVWEAILKYVLAAKSQIDRETYIATSILFVLFVSLLIIIVSLVLYLTKLFEINNFIYITFMLLTYAIAQVWQYYSRALGHNIVYILSGIMSALGNLLLVLLLVLGFGWDVRALFISIIISNIITILIIEYKLKITRTLKRKNFKKSILVDMLRFSFPLVLNLTALWFFLGFGKLLIVNFLGDEANGLYAFANKIALAVGMFGSVVNMAVIEEAIVSSEDEKFARNFTIATDRLFRVFQSFIILILPLVYLLYLFFKGTEYYQSIKYIPLLLLFTTTMTMSTNIGAVFQAISKTKLQFTTTLIGAFTTIVITCSLFKMLDIYAVMLGQFIGAFVMMISRYRLVNRFIEFRLNWKTITLLFVLFCIASYIIQKFSLTMALITYPLIILTLGLINKNEIQRVNSRLKSLFNAK